MEPQTTTADRSAAKEMYPPVSIDFQEVMNEFITDLRSAFPEYAFSLPCLPLSEEAMQQLFEYCMMTYPPRFFDILNKNADIFEPSAKEDTMFLPGCEFKALYHCDGVTEETREKLWKYLQLLLFRIVGSMEDVTSFGECMDVLKKADSGELRQKLGEVMCSLSTFFSEAGGAASTAADAMAQVFSSSSSSSSAAESAVDTTTEGNDSGDEDEDADSDDDENPKPFSKAAAEDVYNRLQGLMSSKIGSLAKELAEDVSQMFYSDIVDNGVAATSTAAAAAASGANPATEGEESQKGQKPPMAGMDAASVLKSLFSDPDRMGNLVKNVGSKLESKLRDGELDQEELLREATSVLGQMGSLPGMSGMKGFMKQFGKMMGGAEMGEAMASMMTHLGGGGGLGADVAATTTPSAGPVGQMKARMRERLEAKRRAQAEKVIGSLPTASGPPSAAELTPIEQMLLAEETAAAAKASAKAKGHGKKK